MERDELYDFLEKYREQTDAVELILGESLRYHTSFHIGGTADIYAEIRSEDALLTGLRLCRRYDLPYFILGNGTNLLVGDGGFRGVVFAVAGLSEVRRQEGILTAGAGTSLGTLARIAAEAGLAGLEFAAGIPGTLGGAVVMNAGAYGGEMKDVIRSVRLLTADGNIREVTKEEMRFGYRSSRAGETGEIVLSAELELCPGDRAEIEGRMRQLQEARREKQPLEAFSAGSTFKRPEGHFAGKLIEDAGLKGCRHGKAAVSEKHAGFLINLGGASAREMRELIEEVRDRVYAQSGVRLEPEVKMIGEFR